MSINSQRALAGLREYPIHGRLREQAPGLTVEMVDSMLRDAWVAGFSAGVEDIQPQVEAAECRAAEIQGAVERVIGGYLIHIASGLRLDRRKTTIADERAWMEGQAVKVDGAVRQLRGIS